MDRIYTILMFEDTEDYVSVIISTLANSLNFEAKVVLFDSAFPSKLPDEKLAPYCPMFLEDIDPPIQTYHLKNGTITKEESNKRIWYQSDFDAAIIDIFGPGDSVFGDRYIEWFDFASFNGPVILMSLRYIPYVFYHHLPRIYRTAKTGQEDWIESIAKILNSAIDLFHDRALPVVGVYGFKKSTQISAYALAAKQFGKRNKMSDWQALWISDTDDWDLAEETFNFLNIENDGCRLNNRRIVENKFPTVSLSNVNQVLKLLFSSEVTKGEPNLILIDVGEELDLIEIDWIKERIINFERNFKSTNWHPLIGVICNSTRNISHAQFEDMMKYCISIISRKELKYDPASWAAGATERFLTARASLKDIENISKRAKHEKDRPSNLLLNAKMTYFQAFLNTLIFGRAKNRISSTNDVANILPWVSRNSLVVASVFNGSTVERDIPAIKQELIHHDLLFAERVNGIKAFNKQGG